MIKTEIGQTTPDRITVRGHDLANELIGQIDFVDMILLVTIGRRCEGNEKDMLNAIMVTVTDHGLTPSALAARLTYLGAPEAPQAAVAAGLLGAGSVFLGAMQDAAVMLREAGRDLTEDSSDEEIAKTAREFAAARRAARAPLYGLGHNIHVDGDPRIPVLRAVSERNGYFGRYWRLLLALDEASSTVYSRRLPANTAGAVGAMVLSMDLPLHLARGLALVGRCAGLLGHLIEDEQAPIGQELWDLVLRQDERNKLPGDPR
ncbi:citryl-CoA lyase [Streptosporangium jiaoheense]|uniref:citryl-CoA lyase n=1 Tax=Streptosporangium sp. CA-115845 TaxID=3240071 RepID=UPI00361967BF